VAESFEHVNETSSFHKEGRFLDHVTGYQLLNMDPSFEAFTAVIFQVEVFWIVTQCSVVEEYRSFGVLSYFYLQYGPPKRWYPTATLHGVTSQITLRFSNTDSIDMKLV
jgi:hypothetical protein